MRHRRPRFSPTTLIPWAPAFRADPAGGVAEPEVLNLDKPVLIDGKSYTAAELSQLIKEHGTSKSALDTAQKELGELTEGLKVITSRGGDIDEEKAAGEYRKIMVKAGLTGKDLDDEVAAFKQSLAPDDAPTDPKKKPADDDETKARARDMKVVADSNRAVIDKTIKDSVGQAFTKDGPLFDFLEGVRLRDGDDGAESSKNLRGVLSAQLTEEIKREAKRMLDSDTRADRVRYIFDHIEAAYEKVLPQVVASAKRLLGDPKKLGRVDGVYEADPFEPFLRGEPLRAPKRTLDNGQADPDYREKREKFLGDRLMRAVKKSAGTA